MMGFAGMEHDTVTGLNLAVYREENPATGRWTGQDPLGFGAGDANLYRYVGNGPMNNIDTSGTQSGGKIIGPSPNPYRRSYYLRAVGELPYIRRIPWRS